MSSSSTPQTLQTPQTPRAVYIHGMRLTGDEWKWLQESHTGYSSLSSLLETFVDTVKRGGLPEYHPIGSRMLCRLAIENDLIDDRDQARHLIGALAAQRVLGQLLDELVIPVERKPRPDFIASVQRLVENVENGDRDEFVLKPICLYIAILKGGTAAQLDPELAGRANELVERSQNDKQRVYSRLLLIRDTLKSPRQCDTAAVSPPSPENRVPVQEE